MSLVNRCVPRILVWACVVGAVGAGCKPVTSDNPDTCHVNGSTECGDGKMCVDHVCMPGTGGNGGGAAAGGQPGSGGGGGSVVATGGHAAGGGMVASGGQSAAGGGAVATGGAGGAGGKPVAGACIMKSDCSGTPATPCCDTSAH